MGHGTGGYCVLCFFQVLMKASVFFLGGMSMETAYHLQPKQSVMDLDPKTMAPQRWKLCAKSDVWRVFFVCASINGLMDQWNATKKYIWKFMWNKRALTKWYGISEPEMAQSFWPTLPYDNDDIWYLLGGAMKISQSQVEISPSQKISLLSKHGWPPLDVFETNLCETLTHRQHRRGRRQNFRNMPNQETFPPTLNFLGWKTWGRKFPAILQPFWTTKNAYRKLKHRRRLKSVQQLFWIECLFHGTWRFSVRILSFIIISETAASNHEAFPNITYEGWLKYIYIYISSL